MSATTALGAALAMGVLALVFWALCFGLSRYAARLDRKMAGA